MKTISRNKIQRMVGRGTGGGGGGGRGVDLAGYATQGWVEQNYVSKAFFSRLFTALDADGEAVEPNDEDTAISNIQAMFGFWTEKYISALGKGDDGGGSGTILNDPLMSINAAFASNPTASQTGYAIVWNGSMWTYGKAASDGIDLNAVWNALTTYDNTHKINNNYLDLKGLSFRVGTEANVTTYNPTGENAKTIVFDSAANGGISVTRNGDNILFGLSSITPINAPNNNDTTYTKVVVDSYGRVVRATSPTTLEGYGITDAKIANGVITLGTNTITPLTDAKIKSDYEWWGQKMSTSGKVNGDVFINMSTFDLSKTDNGVATTIWPGFRVRDNANRNSFQAINAVSANGTNAGRISVYNYNTSGTSVADKGMTISVAKNGDCSISLEGSTTIGGNLTLAATSGTYIKIGGLYLVYDQSNNAIKVSASPTGNTTANFYATGAVSALGISDSGGASTFDESAMWTALAASGISHKIDNSHLNLGTLTIKDSNNTTLGSWTPTANGTITISAGAGDRLAQYALADGASVGSFTHTSDLIYTAKGGGNGCTDKPDGVDAFGVLSFKTAVGYYGQVLMPAGIGRLYVRSSNSLDGTAWNEVALTSDLSAYTKTTSMKSLTIKGGTTNAVIYNPTDASAKTVTIKAGTGMTVTGAANEITITRNDLSASDIPNLDWSKITTGKPTTLSGYGITDAVSSATKWWGQSIQTVNNAKVVKGDMTDVGNITMTGCINMPRLGDGIKFLVGSSYIPALRMFQNSDIVALGYETFQRGFGTNIYGNEVYIQHGIYDGTNYFTSFRSNGHVTINAQDDTDASRNIFLNVGGSTKTSRLYLSNDIYLVVENGGVHVVGGGLYADTFVSALGKGDDGGASTFDESQMWTALGGSISNKQIASSHLSAALAPYATQAWVTQQLGNIDIDGVVKVVAMKSGDNYDSLSGYTQERGSFVAYNIGGAVSESDIGMSGLTNGYPTILSIGHGNRTIQFMGFGWSDVLKYRHVGGSSAPYALTEWKEFVFKDTIDSLLGNYVTTNTAQTIIGQKTFSATSLGSGVTIKNSASDYPFIRFEGNSAGGLGFIGIGKTGGNIHLSYVTPDSNGGYTEGVSQWYTILHTGNWNDTINLTSLGAASASTLNSLINNSSVTLSGETLTVKINGTSKSLTNTWRGIKDELTSTSTTDSLSANQGRLLKNDVTTLQGYFSNGVAKSAAKLSDTAAYTAWGRTFFTNGKPATVSGALESVTNITMSGDIKMQQGHYITAYIDDAYYNVLGAWGGSLKIIQLGYNTSLSKQYATNIYGNTLRLYGSSTSLGILINTSGNVGIGTSSPSAKLDVQGSVKIGGATLTWDSDKQALKIDKGFYSDSFVSALGANASGGSGSGIDANWLKTNDVQIQRLGIGVAPSSSYRLNVQGESYFNGPVSVNSSVTAIGGISTSQGNISAAHNITAGGNGLIHGKLTVGQTSESTSNYKLYIGGGGTSKSIYAEGDIYTHGSEVDYSDVRLKNILEYVNNLSVDMVAKAPIFKYYWKDRINDRLRIGTSAQYWQEVLPQAVEVCSDGYLGMSYAIAALASSVSVARKVVDHELRVKQLEERIAELENEINELKAA